MSKMLERLRAADTSRRHTVPPPAPEEVTDTERLVLTTGVADQERAVVRAVAYRRRPAHTLFIGGGVVLAALLVTAVALLGKYDSQQQVPAPSGRSLVVYDFNTSQPSVLERSSVQYCSLERRVVDAATGNGVLAITGVGQQRQSEVALPLDNIVRALYTTVSVRIAVDEHMRSSLAMTLVLYSGLNCVTYPLSEDMVERGVITIPFDRIAGLEQYSFISRIGLRMTNTGTQPWRVTLDDVVFQG